MGRQYTNWRDLPDDPNRVGDADYNPIPHRREPDEDEEYERAQERELMDDLCTKLCRCGGVLEEVINTEEKIRKGWYCPTCKAFEVAILRERVWLIGGERG